MEVIYRRMEKEDAAAMADIERQSFSRPWSREGFLESFRNPYALFWVAQQAAGGEIVGYCGCYQSFEEGNITNVAVRPDMRRRGIGRGLLSAVLSSGAEHGIQTFVLEVRTSNLPAIHLYESFGFQKEGRRRNFYADPVEDAEIMTCRPSSAGAQE